MKSDSKSAGRQLTNRAETGLERIEESPGSDGVSAMYPLCRKSREQLREWIELIDIFPARTQEGRRRDQELREQYMAELADPLPLENRDRRAKGLSGGQFRPDAAVNGDSEPPGGGSPRDRSPSAAEIDRDRGAMRGPKPPARNALTPVNALAGFGRF